MIGTVGGGDNWLVTETVISQDKAHTFESTM